MTGAGENDAGPPGRSSRAWTPLARALAATGDHWTLTMVLALAPGRMRLTHLRERLPGISTGVLERGVQQMVALGLVSRARFKEMPPRVELELTDAGRELVPVAEALARWGLRHLWSQPRERERVDLGALLRQLPALLENATQLPEGSVEAIVSDADPPVRCCFHVHDGRLRIDERSRASERARANERVQASERGSAQVSGDRDAWIAALSPAGDHSRLRFSGDERLLELIFGALAGPAARGLPQWAS